MSCKYYCQSNDPGWRQSSDSVSSLYKYLKECPFDERRVNDQRGVNAIASNLTSSDV